MKPLLSLASQTTAPIILLYTTYTRNARLYLLSNTLGGISIGIFGVLYNLYLRSLGLGTDFIGQLLLTGTITGGLAIVPAGLLLDRIGPRSALLWGSLAIGVAGLGQIVFRSPLALLVSTGLLGIAGALILIVDAPFLTANSTTARRVSLFSLNYALSLGSSVAGTLLGGFLPLWLAHSWLLAHLPLTFFGLLSRGSAAQQTYQGALIVAGILAAPSLIPIFLMTDDQAEPWKARENARNLSPMESATTTSSLQEGRWENRFTSALQQMTTGVIGRFVLVRALFGFGAGLIVPFFNLFFIERLHASTAQFGIISSVSTVLIAATTLGTPLLVRRWGKVRAAAYTQLASLPFLLALAFTSHLGIGVALYLARSLLVNIAWPATYSFSMEIVNEHQRGVANSAYTLSWQAMWAVGAYCGGWLINRGGYPSTYLLTAVCYLVSSLLLLLFFKGPARGQSKGEV